MIFLVEPLRRGLVLRADLGGSALVILGGRVGRGAADRLDVGGLLGVDPVDLAELLVALLLAGRDGLGLLLLRREEVVLTTAGDLLALELEPLLGRGQAVRGEGLGVDHRLRDRVVELRDLPLREKVKPRPQDEPNHARGHGRAGRAGEPVAQQGKGVDQEPEDDHEQPEPTLPLQRPGNEQFLEQPQRRVGPGDAVVERGDRVVIPERLASRRQRGLVEAELLVIGEDDRETLPA